MAFRVKKIVLALVCLVLGITGMLLGNKDTAQTDYSVEVYELQAGYGFHIKEKGVVLIQQDFIPAVSRNQPFSTPEDAKRVGLLMLSKLRKKENPGVSLRELEAMAIELLDTTGSFPSELESKKKQKVL